MADLDDAQRVLLDWNSRAVCLDSSLAWKNYRLARHGARATQRPVFGGDFFIRRGRVITPFAGRKCRDLGHRRGPHHQRHRAVLDQLFLENFVARGGFILHDFSRCRHDRRHFLTEFGVDGSRFDVGARDAQAPHGFARDRRLRGRLHAHFTDFVGAVFAARRFRMATLLAAHLERCSVADVPNSPRASSPSFPRRRESSAG